MLQARRPAASVMFGVVIAATVAYSCGSDDPVAPPADDAGVSLEGGAEASGEAGPQRAPFGLDARAPNPTCLARARPTSTASVSLVEAFPSLPAMSNLVGAYQAPGDPSRWYTLALEGTMYTFENRPTASERTTFLSLGAKVHAYVEGGLLGFAFHPQWATNRTAFISYTTGPAGLPDTIDTSVVSRIKSTDGGLTLDPATEEVILSVPRAFYGHNGGNLAFGPDGYLYFALGDDGSEDDPDNNGQRKDTLFAKMLRIAVGPTGPYTIPADNPFAGGGGRPEIFAMGLRKAWRWSCDRASGALWVGDVGALQYEEIDIVQKGGNYGWRLREGAHCRPPTAPPCDGDNSLIDPIAEYEHDLGFGGPGSITGGYVYRGKAIPELVGTYVFADFQVNTVSLLKEDAATGARTIEKLQDATGIASFAEDVDGEVYALGLFDGRMKKLVKATGSTTNAMPAKLSETGCFEKSDPKRPVAALVPYEVNAPFWSDGAEKQRWMALPDGTNATVGTSGHVDFPIGTVLAKEFRIGGKTIETRLFVRHDDGGWAGYSYAWDDAQTEATLLPSASSRQVGTQTWSFPSRGQCMTCHNEAAERTLGTEVSQLRRDATYPSTNRIAPQLDTLEHIGLVKGIAASTIPALADPFGSAPPEARARAYLHSNCANCHRPGAQGRAKMDLRSTTAFAATGTCNVAPLTGAFGIADAKLVVPGNAAKSMVVHRMKSKDAYRMPPIARNVVDDPGAALLSTWIGGLTSCP